MFADYYEERRLFRSLLDAACRRRILLFRGESGTGKTTLLNACLREDAVDAAEVSVVAIQLRKGAVTVAEIFYRVGEQVGWAQMAEFVEQVAVFRRGAHVSVSDNRMLGQNQISVALQANNMADREHRRAALTAACFADLQALKWPLLIIMDTYEDAITSVKQWLDGPFLARVALNPQVRVLVAGQEVPDANNIEWGHCCQRRELRGISKPEHWIPVIEAMEKVIDDDEPRSWMAGICYALGGRPSDIMQVIENLPVKGSPA
jgi:hypothetical protein